MKKRKRSKHHKGHAMIILTDTREQQPYEFEAPTERGTLPTGDYSLKGGESLIAIERKTATDLIGCLTRHRDRFERELYRVRSLQYFALVVECSPPDLSNGHYMSLMKPKAAIQSLLTFSAQYGLSISFTLRLDHHRERASPQRGLPRDPKANRNQQHEGNTMENNLVILREIGPQPPP